MKNAHHNHHNRATVTINDSNYFLGKGIMTESMMKKNHFIGTSENAVEYVVNSANGMCYKLLK
jgi:hypothetical protein